MNFTQTQEMASQQKTSNQTQERASPPSNGTQLFRFRIFFRIKAPVSEVGAVPLQPPANGVGGALPTRNHGSASCLNCKCLEFYHEAVSGPLTECILIILNFKVLLIAL